jgi:hypothetical protein
MDEYINGWSIKQATDQLMLDAPHTYTHMPLGSAHGISDRIHSVRASIRDYFNAPSCPLNRFCHAERKHPRSSKDVSLPRCCFQDKQISRAHWFAFAEAAALTKEGKRTWRTSTTEGASGFCSSSRPELSMGLRVFEALDLS